jgi:hypothetical protein
VHHKRGALVRFAATTNVELQLIGDGARMGCVNPRRKFDALDERKAVLKMRLPGQLFAENQMNSGASAYTHPSRF